MSTIFTQIIKGEIPSYKIAENDYCYAFLDIRPIHRGHTLVIPKKEIDYIFDIEGKDYHELFDFAKYIANGIQKTFKCKKVGMTVIGLDVNHAHIHLVPINTTDDMNFWKYKAKLTDEEFKATAEEIASNL